MSCEAAWLMSAVADAESERASACTLQALIRLACACSWSSGGGSHDAGVQTPEAIDGLLEMRQPPARRSAPRLNAA